jgi:hypothetical protein
MANPLPLCLVQWNQRREEAVNTFEGLPGGRTKNLKKTVLHKVALLPRLVRSMMVEGRKVLHKVTLLARLIRRTMILRPSRCRTQ